MPDRDQGDHWDFLAANLGALPAPAKDAKEEEPDTPTLDVEPEVGEPEVVGEPCSEPVVAEGTEKEGAVEASEKTQKRSRGRKGDRVVSGFGHRRGSVDWANLARELGVEAMEEVPDPIPAADAPPWDASTIVDREPTKVEEIVEEEMEPMELAHEQTQPVAERAVSGFGAGLIDDLGPREAAHDESADGDTPQQEERKGRRRRRRRKPRKPEHDQEQPIEAVLVDDEAETEDEAEAKSPSREEREEEGSPRRRGRRRGGRKRAPREDVITESKVFGAGLDANQANQPDRSDEDDSDDFEIFDAADDDDEDNDSTESVESRGERSKDRKQSKKVTHRGIPSWDEAVGYIVDSNMEDRSKKPESSNFRQRPGRRRGGDRSGNRGRP